MKCLLLCLILSFMACDLGSKPAIIEIDSKKHETSTNPCSPLPAGCQCYSACIGGICDNTLCTNTQSNDNQVQDDNDNTSLTCNEDPSLCLCIEACVDAECNNTLCQSESNPCIPLPPDCLCARACQPDGKCKNKKCSNDSDDNNSSGGGGEQNSNASCDNIAGTGETYSNAVLIGPYLTNVANEANVNIKLRGWQHYDGVLDLIDVGGDTDSKCPKFRTIFEPERVPTFLELFQVGLYEGIEHGVEPIEYDLVHLARWQVTPGEIIKAPDHQYDLGQNIAWMVIYIDSDLITLKGTREDSIVYGYAFHFIDICVDPQLRQLYDQGNAAGRGELPGILHGQAIGRAKNTSMIIAIRDTGAFMDPRSRKDWW